MKTVMTLVAACMFLVGCKTTEQSLMESGKKPLSTAQIKQLLSDKEGSGTTARGTDFTIKHTANGKVMVKSSRWEDTGTWSIEGKDLYCNQWTELRKGERECRRVYDTGGEYQFVKKDGTSSSIMRFN